MALEWIHHYMKQQSHNSRPEGGWLDFLVFVMTLDNSILNTLICRYHSRILTYNALYDSPCIHVYTYHLISLWVS